MHKLRIIIPAIFCLIATTAPAREGMDVAPVTDNRSDRQVWVEALMQIATPVMQNLADWTSRKAWDNDKDVFADHSIKN